LLAIDPSLTASGWVLFDFDNSIPLASGVLSPPGPKLSLAKRLDQLQQSVEDLLLELKVHGGDILICEGPAPLVLNPQSSLKVERVRSIFESVARSMNLTVPGRINPRTVQSELLGMRGPQLPRPVVKDCARKIAMQLYGDQLTSLWSKRRGAPKKKGTERKQKIPQDIIDAVLIGALAITKIKLCIISGNDISDAFLPRNKNARHNTRRNAAPRWTEEDLKRLSNDTP